MTNCLRLLALAALVASGLVFACGCKTETYDSNDPSWPAANSGANFNPPEYKLKRPALEALDRYSAPLNGGSNLPTITPGNSPP